MKKLFIAYSIKQFEEFVNRTDIEILNVDVKVFEHSYAYQEGFCGLIFYKEIQDTMSKERELLEEFITSAYPSSDQEAWIFVDLVIQKSKELLKK